MRRTYEIPHLTLAYELAERFKSCEGVTAVALGGSSAHAGRDAQSDIDLYVYSPQIVPLEFRRALAAEFHASRADLDLSFWDPGDEWIDGNTGIEVDLMYWTPAWIEEQIERVLTHHQASMGYSTCFWHTLRASRILFDREGWFHALQERCQQPYPEALRNEIIVKNHAVLRRVIPSYVHQIEKAAQRGDRISLNHRTAAFFASYFDVLFALNRVLHPGEKRLLPWALANCSLLPKEMAIEAEGLLSAAAAAEAEPGRWANALMDHLDELLASQGFDPQTSQPTGGPDE